MVLITFVIYLYIPLFRQYITGCVNTAAGTFVSNNLYSIAFNYVTMQGNSASVMVGESMEAQQ